MTWIVTAILTLFQHPTRTTPSHGTRTTAIRIRHGPRLTSSPMQPGHATCLLPTWTVTAILKSSQHRMAMIPLRGTKTMAQRIRHGLPEISTRQQTALTMSLLRMLTATAISTLSQHLRSMAPSHGTKTTVLRIHLGQL